MLSIKNFVDRQNGLVTFCAPPQHMTSRTEAKRQPSYDNTRTDRKRHAIYLLRQPISAHMIIFQGSSARRLPMADHETNALRLTSFWSLGK